MKVVTPPPVGSSSDDKNFPSVPPLQLSIPADYPDQSPLWSDDGEQYGECEGGGGGAGSLGW